MAIISDDRIEPSVYVQMIDDGSGSSIRIPSVMITEADGVELKKIYSEYYD